MNTVLGTFSENLSVTSLVPSFYNFSMQTSESSSTGYDYTETSCSEENLFAYLLGASIVINLDLIGIIIVITTCKLNYLNFTMLLPIQTAVTAI